MIFDDSIFLDDLKFSRWKIPFDHVERCQEDRLTQVCGPDGERDKIPLPPKVPSGTHHCYSHLCFRHIFTSTFLVFNFILFFWCFYEVPPSFLLKNFPCYPLHFIFIIFIQLYFIFHFLFYIFDIFTCYPLHFIRCFPPATPFILWVYFIIYFM